MKSFTSSTSMLAMGLVLPAIVAAVPRAHTVTEFKTVTKTRTSTVNHTHTVDKTVTVSICPTTATTAVRKTSTSSTHSTSSSPSASSTVVASSSVPFSATVSSTVIVSSSVPASTASSSSKISSVSVVPSTARSTTIASSTSAPTSSTIASSPTSSTAVVSSKTTTPSSTTAQATGACFVTNYSSVSAAVASCTAITLSNVVVPAGETLDLTGLQDGTTVTFAGTTTFGFEASDYNMIEVGGTDITITAEDGAIIDGNGSAWWDGQGSNGGITKPDHFFVIDKALGNSVISNLYIQNWPTHCFEIENSVGLIMENLVLNNSAGNAPNAQSSGLPAAHNTDGFDVSSCNNTIIRDSTVYNQDDCVAITSGNTITVSGMYCEGGHGLSIGSVGGKSNNNVTNIVFENSAVVNSENGARIKTNSNTTGYIANIKYTNIALSNITDYGIDIQQDYLNGGPTGDPTNGVIIDGVTMTNVTGTAAASAQDYYILCGDGSCSNFVFNDIDITGGGTASSCNYDPTGDFTC